MNSDEHYMRKCIELARKAGKKGDFPFGSIVVRNGNIVGEGRNEALARHTVYRHAEMLALTKAQGRLNPSELSECTIFTTVEPCPMCSFAIQELSIRRVVFGLRSPIMGGYTKWNILQDEEVNRIFPNTFRRSPEVIPDFLKEEVIKGWTEWNEEKWSRLIAKGVFR